MLRLKKPKAIEESHEENASEVSAREEEDIVILGGNYPSKSYINFVRPLQKGKVASDRGDTNFMGKVEHSRFICSYVKLNRTRMC